MTSNSELQYLTIQGQTAQGRKFRPSDWAERLCGLLATQDRRQRTAYSRLLKPITRDGVKSVVVAMNLANEQPGLFDQIMHFANSNQLVVIYPESHLPQANVA
ncbi:MAG: DUF3579 domain-containing protein [Gammaproteobacteria bacterium]|nr:DUF3579 domain-containing protein [Gammaproteobacteria bacterium]